MLLQMLAWMGAIVEWRDVVQARPPPQPLPGLAAAAHAPRTNAASADFVSTLKARSA